MKECWLAGKGAGIDSYDWSQADTEETYCVNDAALVVPCKGLFVIDAAAIKRLVRLIPYNTKIYTMNGGFSDQHPNVEVLKWVERKYRFATALLALGVLKAWEYTHVRMVGFDSRNEDYSYAESMTRRVPSRPNPTGYRRINKKMEPLIEELDINLIWENTNGQDT